MPVRPEQRVHRWAEVKRVEENMEHSDIRSRADWYQNRMDAYTPPGRTLGTVLLPSEDTPEEGIKLFHELMTEYGFAGISYCQESLHQNYGTFEDPDGLREDFKLYVDISGESTSEILTLPWKGPKDDEVQREFWAHEQKLSDLEGDHGALIYAEFGNIAADIMEYPDGVRVAVPSDVEFAARQFIKDLDMNRNNDFARILFGVAIEVYEKGDVYANEYGGQNTDPLDLLITEIKQRQKFQSFEAEK